MRKKVSFEVRAIESLIPYARNARTHSPEQVEQIARSIKEFGFLNPVIISANGGILAGHCRVLAAGKLGLKEIPCILETHLTDTQKRAYVLADNQLALNAGWDEELLKIELAELQSEDFDLDLLGFSLEEIENLLKQPDDPATDAKEDDFDEDKTEQRCKKGDVWQLGNHRLMCGDSTDAKCVEKLMSGEKADLFFTDPPYGVNIVQGATVGGGKPFGTSRSDNSAPDPRGKFIPATKYMPIKGDESTETARLSYEIAKEISETQIVFGGNYFTSFLPPSRCWVVWEKGVPEGAFFAPVELAWVNKDANAKLYKVLWSGICREGDRDVEGVKRVHPTQKPVGLCVYILNDFTKDGDNVLDLFGGSGSTLIACEQTNRKCFMMEFEEHYCDVIISRWEQLTGKKAKKV